MFDLVLVPPLKVGTNIVVQQRLVVGALYDCCCVCDTSIARARCVHYHVYEIPGYDISVLNLQPNEHKHKKSAAVWAAGYGGFGLTLASFFSKNRDNLVKHRQETR